jgi:hypothetical protein
MLSFNSISDINFTLFVSGYIGYLITGKKQLLKHSENFLERQLNSLLKSKRIKFKENDIEKVLTVQNVKVELNTNVTLTLGGLLTNTLEFKEVQMDISNLDPIDEDRVCVT